MASHKRGTGLSFAARRIAGWAMLIAGGLSFLFADRLGRAAYGMIHGSGPVRSARPAALCVTAVGIGGFLLIMVGAILLLWFGDGRDETNRPNEHRSAREETP
jgi:integral membrane sensor domain MASE1